MISAPVFLVGAERSGTTLLRLMLDHHPQIAFFHEFEFAADLVGDDGTWPALADYYRHLDLDRTAFHARVNIDRGLSYAELVDSFLQQKRDRDGKERMGATVHRNFHRLTYIWPEARFVHLLRDPRAVGRSVIQKGWAGNLWTAVERWLLAESTWDTVVKTLTPDRYVEIRFENLIASPQTELARICTMMGVAYHDDMLTYSQKSTYDKPDASNAARWRSELDNEAIRLAEARLGPLLTKRGYTPSGLPPLTVTPTMEKALAVQDHKYRRHVRIKRFGYALCLVDYLARRCGITPLHRICQKRINRINEQNLK